MKNQYKYCKLGTTSMTEGVGDVIGGGGEQGGVDLEEQSLVEGGGDC